MTNNKNITSKGSAGLIAVIIMVLLIVGAGAYMLINKTPVQKSGETDKTKTDNTDEQAESSKNIESVADIAISVPEMDFSASPLSNLNVSSLNVAVAQVSTNSIFSAPTVNSDFSYKADLNIPMPAPAIDFQMPSIPANIPNVAPPVVVPSAPPVIAPTPGPTGTGQPPADCSAFSSVPACSYVGASGSQGYEACKQCYPNK